MTQRRDLSSWLPTLIGPLDLQGDAESVVPRRATLNFVGGTVVDNPEEERTDIAMVAPGGQVGEMQWHKLDGEIPRFAGTPKLVVLDPDDDDSEIGHLGEPVHQERPKFYDAADSARDGSFAEAPWGRAATTNATPTEILSIAIPSALGDVLVMVHVHSTYGYSSSGTKGGTFARVATFKRTSGTLALIALSDELMPTTLIVGTAAGGIDVSADGDEAAHVMGTGILATNIEWFTTAHVHVVVLP